MRESPNLLPRSRIPRATSTISISQRRIPSYPIAASATIPATFDLTTSFQDLDIADSLEPILTPQSSNTRPSSPSNTILPSTAIMNSADLAMTFDGVKPKKIDVRMYIQNAETKAMIIAPGQDQNALGLSLLIFYNGLRGAAKRWFEGLSMEVQDDWSLLKTAFNEKYNRTDEAKQTMRQFYQGIRNLRQNNQTLQQYITKADQLIELLDQRTDGTILGFLAEAFVNGIANEYH